MGMAGRGADDKGGVLLTKILKLVLIAQLNINPHARGLIYIIERGIVCQRSGQIQRLVCLQRVSGIILKGKGRPIHT